MSVIAGIGWAAPWLLVALVALPILWLILRAIPPAPIRRRFPGVALLLGLSDDESVTDRTPWWLLLLRMLAVAAVIVGLAGPVLNPAEAVDRGEGPLLVVVDGTWAGAARWAAVRETLEAELSVAAADDRTVGVLQLTRPEAPMFLPAQAWTSRLTGLRPDPWQPDADALAQAEAVMSEAAFGTVLWLSDGLDYAGREAVLAAAEAKGYVRVIQPAGSALALRPAIYAEGAIQLQAVRATAGAPRSVDILAQGTDPAGNARVLARAAAEFGPADLVAETALVLPAELRARVTRFEMAGVQSAGATTLVDDSLRRREVALIAGRADREGLELLAPLHYLEQALAPTADLLTGSLPDILPANPDAIVLADVAQLTETEQASVTDWVEGGGLLVRFAGPRVAASDVGRDVEDPLLPVQLRTGGRTVGGAMSWGEPKALAPFREGSPFFGLSVPDDVVVSAQVMAQPGPELAAAAIAELTDGTPLVTRAELGQGQVVLFHVTANAEWSTLPLSGLFVEMLERLAVTAAASAPLSDDLEGTTWQATRVMDGFGNLSDAGTMPGIDGAALVAAAPSPDVPPGLYQSGDRALARNVVGAEAVLTPATWPARIPVSGLTTVPPLAIGGWLLAAALVMLLLDVIATLALSGRLTGPRGAATAALFAGVLVSLPAQPQAQTTDGQAVSAAAEVVLAHIVTGDRDVDSVALAGLTGLSDTLFFRTSVEPAPPVSVNLETDEIAFFPLLYWPISPDQPTPSVEAYAKLNAYLRAGGMIVFDTRDAHVASFGSASPNGRKLQALAAPLDIPALEPIPQDHVLTRTFYLLQDFPGRHLGRDVWVEAAPPGAERAEGMPFRNLNDGVTPVVIGGNDWAGAWAVGRGGQPLLPVGRGFGGERQRELAYRFGVNLVMHVLTGNYKSDQVHVPALLDRLGQ
ncbi:MAG: DUF4159 domain-containing protein [Pseudomonadota bacterium]